MEPRSISRIKTKKAYQQIVETILELIVQGELEYGNKLYNEQDLLSLLGVSRPTLREALRVLEFLGIVTVGPRRGIVINEPEDSDGYLPLIYIMMFEKTGERALFELRQALQIEMVGYAALRRSPENLDMLNEIVVRTENNLGADNDVFAQLDFDFHMQIMRCAENTLALRLMRTFGTLMRDQLREIIYALPLERRFDTLRFHREIAESVAQRNAEAARATMRRHLERPHNALTDRPLTIRL